GDERTQIEVLGAGCAGRKAAGTLAANQRVRSALDVTFIAEAAKHRVLVAEMVVDARIAAVVVNDLVCSPNKVIEAAGALWQRIDTGHVDADLAETGRTDHVEDAVAAKLRARKS